MASPLVATKLYVPKLRAGILERGRLSARLQRGTTCKLTLISAPAGFGKTTLIAEWLARVPDDNSGIAWLSLDHTDNDPTSFWSHVIIALQAAAPGIGAALLRQLQSGEQPDTSLLSALLNELSALPSIVHLVLDDFHAIDRPEIQQGMTFLVEHLPPNIRLLISTRADPPLPLPRLRARGELVEIRAADLRFTGDEIETYLDGMVGLGLTAKDIATLEGRTEGWIAALQLAALSMQGRGNVADFVANFAGSDRYVVDYLVEEVLQRQSEETRGFLLHTCFLSRLSGSLCEAVTGSSDAAQMLQALDRNNLFVIPLDDRREWYRYHHLFADVLLTHFAGELREVLPALHRRASDWYEQHGERFEAIQHALAGKDLERAAELIELAIPDMQRNRGEAILRGWAHMLPNELVRTRPVLGIGLVGGLISCGEFDGIAERLRDVEHCLETLAEADGQSPSGSAHRVVVVDTTQLPRVPGAVELYRAALAQVRGDVSGIITHAQRVLEVAPADDHLGRAAGSSLLGIAYWSQGDLDAAYRSWSEGKNGLQRAGHIADALGASIALADILLVQGHLRDAVQTCEQALQLATAGQVLRGTADMHAGLSELYRERNDLEAARQHLSRSQELGELAGLPQHPYRWRVAMAHLRQDEGDLEGAVTMLDEAERLYVSDFFPYVRPVAAMRARVWIAQGRLEEARRWQRQSGFGVDDELSYLREFEYITLARLMLAQQVSDEGAVRLLDRLLDAALHGGRMGSAIEISLLQTLAHRGTTDIAAALVPLERALTLAEAEGYVRSFLEGGERMAALLRVALKRAVTPAYTRKLLVAFGQNEPKMPTHPDLIEPLSDRELDVLRLLRGDLGGPEIARELAISLNTMRTHTKNVFEKLGVNNRRSAVHRAEELNLLARNQPQ